VQILEKTQKTFTVLNYVKEGLYKENIKDILKILQMQPQDIIRKNDKNFIKLGLKKEQLSDKQLIIKTIIENPKIMQRPIVIINNKGVIARPPEKIFTIL
tara:strand:- start:150 stop:449 length:300 start_codon:yes stop_codon:yes gene_type:complete